MTLGVQREKEKKKIKDGKGGFGQTFISCLVLTNRAGGAADTAASRASRKINAYGDTSAKARISILHVGLANMQNDRCSAQVAAAAVGGRSGCASGAALSLTAAPAPAPCAKSLRAPPSVIPSNARKRAAQKEHLSCSHPTCPVCLHSESHPGVAALGLK